MLASLQLPFEALASGTDETSAPDEGIAELTARLAGTKADVAAARRPEAVVIAADTCMEIGGKAAGKPKDRADAVAMLRTYANRTCRIATALHVRGASRSKTWLRFGSVSFGPCAQEAIEFSLDASPQALRAEGSFAVDEAGPVLCEEISEDEPGTIAGLPMIALCTALREYGYRMP